MRILSRALLFVSIAIVGAVGCASGGGGIRPPAKPAANGSYAITPSWFLRRRVTRIVVSGPSGEFCTASIDDYRIIGKPGKKVAWLVEDASEGCEFGEDWHIELEFTNAWNNGHDKIVKIGRDDIKSVKIHPRTPPTGAKAPLIYKVYLVAKGRRAVIDPELEIEP